MKVSRVRDVKLPTRGTPQSAGIDFYVPNDYGERSLGPGHKAFIPSGIKANVPPGHALIAFNKSGVALKKHLFVGACVVDEDYQGEIHLHVVNVGTEAVTIESGEKLVQLVLIPVFYDIIEEAKQEELFSEATERGSGGFGSTGKF
jgi:dUTP pyrophosphatase